MIFFFIAHKRSAASTNDWLCEWPGLPYGCNESHMLMFYSNTCDINIRPIAWCFLCVHCTLPLDDDKVHKHRHALTDTLIHSNMCNGIWRSAQSTLCGSQPNAIHHDHARAFYCAAVSVSASIVNSSHLNKHRNYKWRSVLVSGQEIFCHFYPFAI